MNILAICNHKGGVAKTATAVNLAFGLAGSGLRTLLVDLDTQANATRWLGIEAVPDVSVREVLQGKAMASEAVATISDNLACLPSSLDLACAEMDLFSRIGREFILKTSLEDVVEDFDVAIIDCASSLGLFTMNAMTAATHLLIPVQCELLALHGVSGLLDSMSMIKSSVNPHLSIIGVAATLFMNRSVDKQSLENIRNYFGELMFESVIRRDVKMAEAPGEHQSIFDYAPYSNAAFDYKSLTDETIRRLNNANQ